MECGTCSPYGKKELCVFSLLLSGPVKEFYCLMHPCGHSLLWGAESRIGRSNDIKTNPSNEVPCRVQVENTFTHGHQRDRDG